MKPLIESALTEEQVTGETVQIKFVPLSVIKKLDRVLWSKNAKKHDIEGVYKSIERYGFIDPPKWDINLNEGKGGLIYGNGRTETIVSALLEAQKQKLDPPRGIPTAIESGEWCIPIKFGVDTESEAQAIAAAIDHNNLTLSGSDLDIRQMSEIWDESYLEVLNAIADDGILPVTVSEDDLAALLTATDDIPDSHSTGAGDQSDQLTEQFQVLVTCKTEVQQAALLDRLIEEGYECRSLIS